MTTIDWQLYLNDENRRSANADRKYRYHNISLEGMGENAVYKESSPAYDGGEMFQDDLGFINSIKNIKLQKAIKKLTEKQKTVVELYFGYGYKQSEIAQILKCSQSSISERLSNSIKTLKKHM